MLKRHLHYQHGKRTKKPRLTFVWLLLSIVLVGSGLYLLVLLRAPAVKQLDSVQQSAFVGDKQIIIPKIAVKVPVLEGQAEVLDKGAWHRLPQLGDPETGGNFIVSGHRYVLASTPGRTKEQSYFYNIDKLVVGDQIFADWHHKRHTYKVSKIYTVKPTQLEIESPSADPKLTLYTCTLAGSADGRVVIEAVPTN